MAITLIARNPIFSGGGASFSHGDTVPISGSGFGSTLPTFSFAGGVNGDIETTASGTLLPLNGNVADSDTNTPGTFNWRRFKSGGTNYPKAGTDPLGIRGQVALTTPDSIVTGGSQSASEYRLPSGVGAGGKLYASFWLTAKLQNTGSGQSQFKYLRIGAGSPSAIQDQQSTWIFHCFSSGPGDSIIEYCDFPAARSYYATAFRPTVTGTDPEVNGWQRVELFWIPGTAGTNSGSMNIRVHRGNSVPSFISATSIGGTTNGAIRTAAGGLRSNTPGGTYNWLIFQNYTGNGYYLASDGYYANDDHYVGTGSFKRVELWNTLDPATATIREIQQPISWSDSSVSVKLNKGGAPAGTYYLVVLADSVTDTVIGSRQITVL